MSLPRGYVPTDEGEAEAQVPVPVVTLRLPEGQGKPFPFPAQCEAPRLGTAAQRHAVDALLRTAALDWRAYNGWEVEGGDLHWATDEDDQPVRVLRFTVTGHT